MTLNATFDPTLATAKDWVRFTIGDTDTEDPTLDDATIDAILRQEPNRWFAAATCAEAAFTKWQQDGDGLVSKQVGALSITRESGSSASQSYLAHIRELRARGARELSPAPYSFRAL